MDRSFNRRTNTMKTIITATAAVLLMSTAAMAGSTKHVTHDGTNYGTGNNGKFVALPSPTNGQGGTDGQDGDTGATGAIGQTGAQGTQGAEGATGDAGKDAVAPLGSLSFAAATSAFYGDGMGFGLSNSNYGSLEGSIVFGFDLDNDWRVVAGITTDFKGKTAGSVGVGVSF